MRTRPIVTSIAIGGVIAGTCDITYAVVFYAFRGAPPIRVLQSVASGLLGSEAFAGGVPTAVLGLALHYLIALTLAAIFVFAAQRIPFLTRRPLISGAAFGFAVYWVMNLVVLPLSAFPRKVTFPPLVLVTGLAVHMALVGIPIALAARRSLPTVASGGPNGLRG